MIKPPHASRRISNSNSIRSTKIQDSVSTPQLVKPMSKQTKQFQPLGNWLYRVKLKDGNFAIIDGTQRWFYAQETFRISEDEIRAIIQKQNELKHELHNLKFTGKGEPRKRTNEQRITEIERWFEELKPSALEYRAFQDRQHEIKELHKIIEGWRDTINAVKECKSLLERNGFAPCQRVEYMSTPHVAAVPGILIITKATHRPCVTVLAANSGLFGHTLHSDEDFERVFHPGLAPAPTPSIDELLSPLVGKVVALPNGAPFILESVRNNRVTIRRQLKSRRGFAIKSESHYDPWKFENALVVAA